MDMRTACYVMGSGNRERGRALIVALAKSMRRARKRKPVLGVGMIDAADALWRDIDDMDMAARGRGEAIFTGEALEAAATAMRAVNGEYGEYGEYGEVGEAGKRR